MPEYYIGQAPNKTADFQRHNKIILYFYITYFIKRNRINAIISLFIYFIFKYSFIYISFYFFIIKITEYLNSRVRKVHKRSLIYLNSVYGKRNLLLIL